MTSDLSAFTESVEGLVNVAEPDELVVDLPHRDLVAGTLVELDVLPRDHADSVESHQRLGLALLTGLDLGRVEPRVRAAHGEVIDALQRNGRTFSPLDLLLFELRHRFAESWNGWTPQLGKNRTMARVVGSPYYCPMSGPLVGVLAEGNPVPVDSRPPRPVSDAGAGVRVGILDTGLYPHRELAGRYLATHDTLYRTRPDRPIPPWAGHATFVADLVLQQAPAAELLVRQVLDNTHGCATAWTTVNRIMDFADDGVHVLNLSLGCFTEDGEPPLAMTRALQRLHPDTVVVAAVGNHGSVTDRRDGLTRTSPYWPAAMPGVVAVGADPTGDDRSGFSPDVPWITCTAPGVDVVAAFLDGPVEIWRGTDPPTLDEETFTGYARWSGTSFAAATISGTIAARTVPGRISPREALADLLDRVS